MNLTGDVQGKFIELLLLDVPTFDCDGPISVRAHNEFPYFYVVAVLQSDYFETRERYHFAFDPKLAALGIDVLSRAVNDEDAIAMGAIGRHLLYEAEDLAGAVIYLKRALAGGEQSAVLDLTIAAMFLADAPSAKFDQLRNFAA